MYDGSKTSFCDFKDIKIMITKHVDFKGTTLNPNKTKAASRG